MKLELYKPVKSNKKFKKYMVLTKRGVIHFGDNRYGQFRDKLGLYSKLDHKDPKRREAYYARHKEKGLKDKERAKYYSHKYLW